MNWCTWESLHSPTSTIGLRKALRPTWSQSQERKMANYLRKEYEEIWSRECLSESLNEATEGSTGRTSGPHVLGRRNVLPGRGCGDSASDR
jgi:hypothetical protein